MNIEFVSRKKQTEDSTQEKTVVFIDYEYMFISFTKNYSMPPMLDEIFEELKQQGRITQIYVFGDFMKAELSQERKRVRTMTSNIIDCGDESLVNKKDFTDFIMLDHIYQVLIQDESVTQFIFFTGDGHFASAAAFIKNFMDITVGVYGIEGSLSNHLCNCSSWAKELRAMEEDDSFYQRNLLSNFRGLEQRGAIITFKNTVEFTSRNYGGDLYRYEQVLREMINRGQVISAITDALANRGPIRVLSVNWEKIEKDLGIKLT